MSKVYNKRDPNIPKDAIYVGRPSMWGNPFEMKKESDRDMVVLKFRNWLRTKGPKQDAINNSIKDLAGKDLVCWCAPKACHADVLLEIANS